MYWRRKWQLTPVFLPGESQGRGSLVSCHLWGRTESDTTESDLAAAGLGEETMAYISGDKISQDGYKKPTQPGRGCTPQ